MFRYILLSSELGVLLYTPFLRTVGKLPIPSVIALFLFGKVLISIINGKLVNQLTSHKRLSNRQNSFRFFRSTADMLTSIIESVYNSSDKNSDVRPMTLDISMALEIVLNTGLLDEYWA